MKVIGQVLLSLAVVMFVGLPVNLSAEAASGAGASGSGGAGAGAGAGAGTVAGSECNAVVVGVVGAAVLAAA